MPKVVISTQATAHGSLSEIRRITLTEAIITALVHGSDPTIETVVFNYGTITSDWLTATPAP